jgi:hypothetical protein
MAMPRSDAAVRTAGSRIVVAAFVAYLFGLVALGTQANNTLGTSTYIFLTTALIGVVPVGLAALCGVPLVRLLDDYRVPLIGQSFAVGICAAVGCGIVAKIGFAVFGPGIGMPGFMAAAIAAWCGFFGVFLARGMHLSRVLFRVALVVSVGSAVAGAVLMTLTHLNGWPYA